LRRLGAASLDWSLLFLLLTAVSLAALPWEGAALAGATVLGGASLATLAYFAVGWAHRGQTLGMRAAGIVVRRHDESEALSRRGALLRALLALISGASAFLVFAFALGDRPEGGYSKVDLAIAGSALVWAGASVAGHLWQLVDRRKQSWQDKLFGLVVVRAETESAAPSPEVP
jgi:uncharacterized RDD family membrane protein YckC